MNARQAWAKALAVKPEASSIAKPRATQPAKREHSLQCEVVRCLRPLIEAHGGRLLAVNGELAGGRSGKELRFVQLQRQRLAAGYLPGSPDLAVFWPVGRCGVIELKAPAGQPDMLGKKPAAGQLKPSQRAFRDWCQEAGLPHVVARSVEEVRAALVAWGALPMKGR